MDGTGENRIAEGGRKEERLKERTKRRATAAVWKARKAKTRLFHQHVFCSLLSTVRTYDCQFVDVKTLTLKTPVVSKNLTLHSIENVFFFSVLRFLTRQVPFKNDILN